jgi:hypothetical protein
MAQSGEIRDDRIISTAKIIRKFYRRQTRPQRKVFGMKATAVLNSTASKPERKIILFELCRA